MYNVQQNIFQFYMNVVFPKITYIANTSDKEEVNSVPEKRINDMKVCRREIVLYNLEVMTSGWS